jgi:predicted GIY-YIG superfamily endonuclease
MAHKNKEAAAAYHKKWYEKNKEKCKEQMRKRYHDVYKGSENLKKYLAENRESRRSQWLKNSAARYQRYKESSSAAVYAIVNNVNGMTYVGQTNCFLQRVHTHKSNLAGLNSHTNKMLQQDYDKYGKEAFDFVVLKEICAAEYATEEEMKRFLLLEEKSFIKSIHEKGIGIYNFCNNPANNHDG